jgi:hypothetical protein
LSLQLPPRFDEDTTMSTSTGTENRSGRSQLARQLKEDGKARLESGKRSAADQIAQIAEAIDAAGAHLDRDQPTISSYATRLADGVGNLAHRLRDSSLEDLGQDIRNLASRRPGLFLLGGLALGIVLARVARVSNDVSPEDEQGVPAEEERMPPTDVGGAAGTDSYSATPGGEQ